MGKGDFRPISVDNPVENVDNWLRKITIFDGFLNIMSTFVPNQNDPFLQAARSQIST